MNPAVAPRALLPALVTRALAGGGLHFACSLLLSPFAAALASADATWLPSETDFDTEAPQPTPVVLVHGLFSRPGHFRFLHRFLVVRGFQPGFKVSSQQCLVGSRVGIRPGLRPASSSRVSCGAGY